MKGLKSSLNYVSANYVSALSKKVSNCWQPLIVSFKKLEPLSGFVGRLVYFVFISAIFLVITILVSLNVLLPGTIFKVYVFPALLFAPFILGYIITSIQPRKKATALKKPLNRKFLFIFIAVMLVATIAITFWQERMEDKHLENAHQIFSIVMIDDIDQARVDSTLIELDSQLLRLDKAYGPLKSDYKIRLILYDNIESLQKNTNAPKWADAYITFRSGVPEVHLPVERASSGSRKTNTMASPKPGHEIAHYVIYEIVGENNKEQIPLWFNEGFAQYESLKGFSFNRILVKPVYRFGIWLLNLSNPKILEDDKFITQSRNYPDEYIDVFYIASMEFVDYISTNYGGIKNILHRVSNGEPFSVAFEEETGKTYADMYEEWHERFF